ncbi:ABC transporter permease [Thermomicrobiaceae bacterium CFH 74404]|uniref:ABC transporter permease n=1 Tax=Thermalbibacter longus TaxID=2951981 RepID=A0AA41WJG2_9BACT|nr:ABC transporter permease [Thermalbibacter longus]MCM8750516.1 ABC transporter permease [Thermalbibacter longus]
MTSQRVAQPAATARPRAASVPALLRRVHAPTILVLILLVVAWAIIAARTSPYVLPSPEKVGRTLLDLARSGDLWAHVAATLYRVTAGFLLGTALALVLGLLASSRQTARGVLRDINAVLNATSVFVWIVLALIWFGLTDRAPIFTTLMITIPVLLSNVFEGIDNLDRKFLEMAQVYRFGPYATFFHITVPSLVPYLFAGMRVAFALGLRVSVVAEIFGVSTGVGYMMNYARDTLRTDAVFAWAVVLILMMLLLDNLVFAPLLRWLTRWR